VSPKKGDMCHLKITVSVFLCMDLGLAAHLQLTGRDIRHVLGTCSGRGLFGAGARLVLLEYKCAECTEGECTSIKRA